NFFTIKSGLISLASAGQLYQYGGDGEVGIQMGDGTQSNFIKLVMTKTHAVIAMEINDAVTNTLMVPIPLENRPNNSELVELSFLVNAVTGEVEATYQIGDNSLVSVGKIQTTGKILSAIQQENNPLAVGIIGTSKDPSQEFIASWDYFYVVGEMPYIIRTLPDIERIMGDA